MSRLAEPESVETLEFKWGTKRGAGKNKKVQFYESFTYDGVDYTLYDTVYLYKEDEPEPYIGKLTKIWENDDTKAKKVKIHWFFRPSEISNWIEEGMVLEKEIFLASGEGYCSASVNPLEAILAKCNVVCTLKDERNPQPSAQELELADYFFYRTFDVEHCTIKDLTGDKVSGLEVEFVFNRKDKNNSTAISDKKQKGEKHTSVDAVDSRDVARSSFQKTLSRGKTIRGFGNVDFEKPNTSFKKVEADDEVILAKGSGALQNAFPSKPLVNGSETSFKNRNVKSVEAVTVGGNDSRPLKKSLYFVDKKPNLSLNKAKVEDAVKVAKESGALENRLLSKSVADDSEASCKNGNVKSVEMLNVDGKNSKPLKKSSSFIDEKMKNGERKDSVGLDKVVKADKFANPITKSENKESCLKLNATSDKNGVKDLITSVRKRKPDDGCLGPDKDYKPPKIEVEMTKLSNGKLPTVYAADSASEERSEADKFEVTPRPYDERSKWFRALPWEERIKSAYEQGTLIQLSNVDPGYASSEVEDIIWSAFKEYCTAKMVQHTANPSPHYGYAHIIMKTKAAADRIIKKLEDGCLMLPNGRPLVVSKLTPLNFPEKQSTFIGHLSVNKMKRELQKETREAVSTSHCSQPNTIEFEMALEWCLLQARSDEWWKRLYKEQGEELRKLKATPKLE